ncbi:MAG: NADP-dependent malic enzyme, partial [Planctomycetota bacterium]
MSLAEDALRYHSEGRKGKIEVRSTKPTRSQRDLSLAYSPGVAEPCLKIAADPSCSFEYTARANLVAVISNGTAVLGLGNIGPLASKPVMEGKAVLFKRFADIDVFDLELDATDPEDFIRVVRALAPGFGGINLEDIKAPECYEIERRLREEVDVPVFHDDQHGTAIICGAALLNALELAQKSIREITVVMSGAGAAAISCARLFRSLGVGRDSILLVDSKGVIYTGRAEGMNPYKEEFQVLTRKRSLRDAMEGADVFVGLSVAGLVDQDMVRSMAANPIVFALANPDSEISYPDAMAAREDVIAGTGRSDFPNQINNVLGFPFIFRGALDVHATDINEPMKLAAVHALAKLAKEDVPGSVTEAYGKSSLYFGREYLIPKPFDPRALVEVSSAVAEAAMKSGVARQKVKLKDYREHLENLLGRTRKIMRTVLSKVRKGNSCRIVFPEGEEEVILQACHQIVTQGIGTTVVLGNAKKIRKICEKLNFRFDDDELQIIDPRNSQAEDYSNTLYQLRKYKGLRREDAKRWVADPIYYGTLMLKQGHADCLLSGVRHTYAETIRPALQIIRVQDWLTKVSGLYIISVRDKVFFFADTTVNIDPTASELAEIAICAAETARQYGVDPRVAMLSFSNAGSTDHEKVAKVREAL